MYNEGVTSLPVLDNQRNVVGNISHVDVRVRLWTKINPALVPANSAQLLTKNTSTPLLRSSCLHFISVILSERGVDDGKDSYPVFYVHPISTLAHTVAKLSATRSHRLVYCCYAMLFLPDTGSANQCQNVDCRITISSFFRPANSSSHTSSPGSSSESTLAEQFWQCYTFIINFSRHWTAVHYQCCIGLRHQRSLHSRCQSIRTIDRRGQLDRRAEYLCSSNRPPSSRSCRTPETASSKQ
jgi:hypothetical protein